MKVGVCSVMELYLLKYKLYFWRIFFILIGEDELDIDGEPID